MAQIFNEEKEYKTFNEETIKITLKDSKHMLGASQIQVEENGHRYGYSGDFNSDLMNLLMLTLWYLMQQMAQGQI